MCPGNLADPKRVRHGEWARRQCRLALGVIALTAALGPRPLGAQSCVQLPDSVYRRGDAMRRVGDERVVLRVRRLTFATPCVQWASDSAAQFMAPFGRYHHRVVWETYVAGAAAVVGFVFTTQQRYGPALAAGVPAVLLTFHANHNWNRATASLDDAIRVHNAAIRPGGR